MNYGPIWRFILLWVVIVGSLSAGMVQTYAEEDAEETLGLTCGGQSLTRQTGSGNDTVEGTNGDDSIFTDGGDDTIYLFDNPNLDTGCGGDGRDVIWGDGGDDYLKGGKGRDDLHLGARGDTAFAGDGDYDEVWGGDGDDWISGGDGCCDTGHGGPGNDVCTSDVEARESCHLPATFSITELEQIGADVGPIDPLREVE